MSHLRFDEDTASAALARFSKKDKSGIDREVGKRWFDAARCSDFVTMSDLLELSPNLVEYRGGGTSYGFIGSTALHWAAARGSEKILVWLIRHGADINALNNGGSTPLHSACSNGQPNTVRILIQAGASTTYIDCCGDVAADVIKPGCEQQLRAIIRGSEIEATLHRTPQQQWTVSQMKEALRLANRPLAGLTEKAELIAAVQDVLASLPEAPVDPSQVNRGTRSADDSEGEDSPDDDDDDDETEELAANEAKEKGNAAYRDGDSRAAIKWYTLAINMNPRCAAFYANRSAAYMSIERFELALDDARKAIEREPDWAKGHYRKGCACLQLGKPLDAVWAFNTAVKLSSPPSAELLGALEVAKQAVQKDQPSQGGQPSPRDGDAEKPRVKPKHAWFDCVLCDNRTRDYAETPCCKKSLCGTCLKRAGPACPYKCS
ncbi:Hsp70-Hsp90 organizing protein 3 [Diplonema papillatum]|nr:Hsp70-Hsp90 organizing protein 3 [Diplonema papillatum]|eukprot:gene6065-9321_t